MFCVQNGSRPDERERYRRERRYNLRTSSLYIKLSRSGFYPTNVFSVFLVHWSNMCLRSTVIMALYVLFSYEKCSLVGLISTYQIERPESYHICLTSCSHFGHVSHKKYVTFEIVLEAFQMC